MSHYYTAAQLAEMRQAQIRAQLDAGIARLRESIQTSHAENTAKSFTAADEHITAAQSDNAISGYDSGTTTVSADSIHQSTDATQRHELDFTDLLAENHEHPTQLELELDAWIRRAQARPVASHQDAQDRTRLIAQLAAITRDPSLDIEDKVAMTRMRVTSYLDAAGPAGGTAEGSLDARQREARLEYRALCQLTGQTPEEGITLERLEDENARMTEALEKREADRYVMAVIDEVMDELGCHETGEAVLDQTKGHMYSVDGQTLCDVFVGSDDDGIMFEPVGSTQDDSLDSQRAMEASAKSVCSLYAEVERRAAARGVFLKRIYMEDVNAGDMYTFADVTGAAADERRTRTAAPRERAVGEGE